MLRVIGLTFASWLRIESLALFSRLRAVGPFGVVLLSGCGGIFDGDSGSGNSNKTMDIGDGPPMSSKPAQAEDVPPCEPGTRREALPEEDAEYCVCGDHKAFQCYGPTPNEARPTGACTNTFAQQGSGDGNCFVQHNCGSKVYALSCVNTACFCIVNNTPTVEVEPRNDCPIGPELNGLCGWALTIPSGSPTP
jgi:hypothetical protein